MTGDAQAEAERIVTEFASHAADLHAPSVAASQPPGDRLVAALAAAIEVDTALQNRDWVDDPVTAEERLVRPGRELRAALSALRARAGEETG